MMYPKSSSVAGLTGRLETSSAVEKVIDEHAREGLPIYFWCDGRVVEISLQEMRERSARNHAE